MQEIKVKPGYKMSELGVIPEDWEVSKLGDIADFFKGKGLPKSDIVIGGKYKCIHYGELFTKYKEYITKIKSYTNNKDNVFLSKENDVLMPTSDVTPNGLATASCINQNNVILGGDVLVIRNNSNNLHGVYFSYNITQNKPRVMKLVSGTTVYHLYGSDMKNYQFLLPTNINEQKAIAEVLSDTDELINSLYELIVKKEKIKEGAMQELLTGKRKLPGFNGEWEEKTLGDIVNFKNGLAHENSISDNGEYIVVNSKFISTSGEVKKLSNECFCPVYKDDVLMVMSDIPNGKAIAKCFIVDEDNKYTLNQRICSLKIHNNYFSKFIYFLINRNKYYLSFDDGVKQTNLRKEDVLGCNLLLPPTIEEQKAISKVLSDLDIEIEVLKTKRDKYIKIKEGMMQELLTGKTRLV